MTAGVFRAGIGRLTPSRGPGELRVWRAAQPPRSSLRDGPVEVNILLDGTDDLDLADLRLVAEVLGRVDHYLRTGLLFAHGALAADPSSFGLTAAEMAPYRELRAEDLPLESPQLNFCLDEWHLHFTEGLLPICDPYGLAVAFDGRRPVRMVDLSDAEIID